MMEECKKENEEIKEAVEQLTRELYEIRERSRLTYNTEMYEARKKGLEEGKKIGEKRGEKRGERKEKREIARKMKEEGIDIQVIQKITELTKKEIENI